MNHLEWHPHAFIDDNNVVVNIAVFNSDDHDTELIEQVREVNGYKQAICCCTFGQPYIGDTWDEENKVFVTPPPSQDGFSTDFYQVENESDNSI